MRKFARYFSLTFAWLYNLLPWKMNVYLGRFLAFIWVDVLGLRKKVVYDNIDLAFPGQSEETKKKWMRRSLWALCQSVFDVVRIPYVTDKWIDKYVVIHGVDNIPKDHKGILFLCLHIGSGDLAGSIVSRRIIPLSLISKRFKSAFADEFWFSLRTQSATEFIDAHAQNNAFDILKALKRKRGVVFVIDQFMGKPYGVESLFFGHKTGTAYGMALFAKKTKAPVMPLYPIWHDETGKMHIYIDPPIDLSDLISEDKEDDAELSNQRIVNRLNQVLENIIRKKPEQWMWVHRRWKVFE